MTGGINPDDEPSVSVCQTEVLMQLKIYLGISVAYPFFDVNYGNGRFLKEKHP